MKGYRYKGEFQINVGNKSSVTGQINDDWVKFSDAYFNIDPVSGREQVTLQAVQSRMTSRVSCHYVAGILPTMRVKIGTWIYNILEVIDENMRHRKLILSVSGPTNET